jgi:uncharacterized protein YkwD
MHTSPRLAATSLPTTTASRRGGIAVFVALALLVAAPAAAAEGATVVVTARLLGTDPGAPPGTAGYLVEVDEVRHGGAVAGVLAVRLAPGDAIGRRLAADALASGEPLELTLVPEADGSHRATAVRATGGGPPADPFPPPLAAEPEEVAAGRSAGLRSLTAAATAGAPFEHQVLEIVNEERLANGNLPPLKGVGTLDAAAGGHSTNMEDRDFFAHCDPDAAGNANEFHERMTAAGYAWNTAAENIAAGQPTPQAVMTAWMGSFGHRTNILSTAYWELGVGHAHDPNDLANVRQDLNGDCTADSFNHGPFDHYWTQNFGRRNAVYPVIVERELYETACAAVDLYTYGAGVFSHMRFSNDAANWSAWMPFSPVATWTLPAGASGTATVWAQLGNGVDAFHQATDTIRIAAGYPATADLDLSAQTVTTTQSWTACDTITAGDGFHVAASGDVTFTARTIVLTDGFSVAAGGSFRAITR